MNQKRWSWREHRKHTSCKHIIQRCTHWLHKTQHVFLAGLPKYLRLTTAIAITNAITIELKNVNETTMGHSAKRLPWEGSEIQEFAQTQLDDVNSSKSARQVDFGETSPGRRKLRLKICSQLASCWLSIACPRQDWSSWATSWHPETIPNYVKELWTCQLEAHANNESLKPNQRYEENISSESTQRVVFMKMSTLRQCNQTELCPEPTLTRLIRH